MEVPSPAHKDTQNMLVYNITSSSYNYHLFHALFGTRIHYHRKLFDITAAFDTVDHELLISQLERQFGLRGIVLAWFQSYMSIVWQNIPCRVQRLYVVHHLHRLLSATRLSTRPAVVHRVHS